MALGIWFSKGLLHLCDPEPTAKGLVDLSLFQFSQFLVAFTFPIAFSNVMLFCAIMETFSAMLINDRIEVMVYGCIKANLKLIF